MARIAVTDGMAPEAVAVLEKAGHEVTLGFIEKADLLSGALKEFDAIIVRSATKLASEIIDASSGLKVIGRAGVGVDNIDLESAGKSGVMVVNAPNASTQSVVELTIGHLLSSLRHIPRSDRGMRDGKWEKSEMKGTELSGKCLGLIGFGRIAQGVAAVATAMGMEIHTYDPYLPPKVANAQGAYLHKKVDTLFKTCTHISIHCNLTEETHHLVDKKRMNLMPGKQGRIECGNHIVNCARGGIIDEVALLTALENGTVTSAALDVFEVEPVTTENKLIQHPNFHGTPHIGAATKEAQSRVGLDIAAAVIEALSGKKPQTLVNSKYLD
ncbi:MAG: hydroxyacid dehydrogenase [Euryarchaeota archaeon]|jgi:D-3-phosphoglycerate dehydrogenase / 2-oxoglutarate reductase|nr:hydroxyacid dehydrogenase [Euryarchaeota archaeon]MBT5185058.1 hydroxyacid dehydrogenase [Euryarchaeota archaeon]